MSDQNRTIPVEELAISNMYSQEALLRLLVKKGVITQEEFLQELEALKREQVDKRREN